MHSKAHISSMASQPMAKSQQGVVLLESLIAILIFSMGILALVGLQAAMIRNTTASNFRAEANHIAQQKLGELWTNSTLWSDVDNVKPSDTVVAELPSGRSIVMPINAVGGGQVKIVITWQQPGETEVHNVTTNARIRWE